MQIHKSRKTPDIELHVKDPYDDLLSMILDGSSSTDDEDALRLSPICSPPPPLTNTLQGRFKLKEESPQPALNRPAIQPASESTGSAWLETPYQVAKSKTLNEQPVESRGPPSVKGRGYTELFIEEEDEASEDEEKDVRVFNGRLSPQVEHGVRLMSLNPTGP